MKLRYSRLLIFLGLFFLGVTYGNTAIGNVGLLSKVRLAATLHGQPAMKEAEWRIDSLDDPQQPAVILPRHSGTVFLAPGRYRATITVDQRIHVSTFRVETDADNLIRVPVD
jgi:hypothetical protein